MSATGIIHLALLVAAGVALWQGWAAAVRGSGAKSPVLWVWLAFASLFFGGAIWALGVALGPECELRPDGATLVLRDPVFRSVTVHYHPWRVVAYVEKR